MAFPTMITVNGTLKKVDGTPERGHIVFQAPTNVLSSTDATVIVPSYKVVTLDANGAFSVSLPASNDPSWNPNNWTYRVSEQLTSGKRDYRTIVPYDAIGGQFDYPDLVPAIDVDAQLYALYNHTHPGGGGSTVDWADIVNKPTTFPPAAHTHDDRYYTESEVTAFLAGKENTGVAASLIAAIDFPVDSVAGKTGAVTLTKSDVGLSNVDNTSDASKPISTATQTALNGKANTSHTHVESDVTNLVTDLSSLDSRVTALEGSPGGGTSISIKRVTVTSGDVTPSTDGDWTVWSAAPSMTIPASVGDYVSIEAVDFMYSAPNSGSYLDWAVVVSGSPVRCMSTDTSTPALEGSPALYPNPSTFRTYGPVFEFVVQSGDISGGNVTVSWLHKGSGVGTVFASTNYPYKWRALNYGPISVS